MSTNWIRFYEKYSIPQFLILLLYHFNKILNCIKKEE